MGLDLRRRFLDEPRQIVDIFDENPADFGAVEALEAVGMRDDLLTGRCVCPQHAVLSGALVPRGPAQSASAREGEGQERVEELVGEQHGQQVGRKSEPCHRHCR